MVSLYINNCMKAVKVKLVMFTNQFNMLFILFHLSRRVIICLNPVCSFIQMQMFSGILQLVLQNRHCAWVFSGVYFPVQGQNLRENTDQKNLYSIYESLQKIVKHLPEIVQFKVAYLKHILYCLLLFHHLIPTCAIFLSKKWHICKRGEVKQLS